METSRAVMPLLTELGGLGEGFCYKHVAPDGAFSVTFSTGLTHLIIGNECAKFWRVAGKARRRSIAARSATEEQRRQRPVRGLAQRVAGSLALRRRCSSVKDP